MHVGRVPRFRGWRDSVLRLRRTGKGPASTHWRRRVEILETSQSEIGSLGMYYGSSYDTPSFEASITVVPNSISKPQGWENRNGAAAIGIRLDFPRGETGLGLFGDTLRVVVDLTALQDTSRTIWDGYEPDIVAATVECLKLNARRRWSVIRFLAVEVRGADEYQSNSGTYGLESITCAPRARQVIARRPRAGEQE